MKKRYIVYILLLILAFVGISNVYSELKMDKEDREARAVIKQNFKYKEENDVKGYLSTISYNLKKNRTNISFDNIKFIKVISISKGEPGQLYSCERKRLKEKLYKAKIYNVRFLEITKGFKFGTDFYNWTFSVIKETKTSPWLIDNYGEG